MALWSPVRVFIIQDPPSGPDPLPTWAGLDTAPFWAYTPPPPGQSPPPGWDPPLRRDHVMGLHAESAFTCSEFQNRTNSMSRQFIDAIHRHIYVTLQDSPEPAPQPRPPAPPGPRGLCVD